MDINQVFAFGSTVNVLIRCKTAMTINGQNYAANEPYTLLNNVNVSFDYGDNRSDINVHNGSLLAYKTDYPEELYIDNVTLTDKISQLLFKINNNTSEVSIYTKDCSDNFYIEMNAKDIFLYKNNNLITDYTYNAADGNIVINNYDTTATYLLFYSYNISQASYDLTSPDFSYFTLELFGTGNKTKETMDVYLKIASAKLLPTKNMSFKATEGNNSASLVFKIIKDDNYIVFK